MQTRNHFALSRYMLQQEPTLIRHKLVFLLGSIMPDINLLTYIKGHTFGGTIDQVRQVLEQLMSRQHLSLWDTYRLGKAVHYVADYFTLPHNSIFKGSLREHCRYERLFGKAFLRYLKAHPRDKGENIGYVNGRRLTGTIIMGHQDYLKNRLSMSDDCRYIIDTCTFVTHAVCAKRLIARPRLHLKHTDHVGITAFAQGRTACDYNLIPRPSKIP